jgi:hypothetical protein
MASLQQVVAAQPAGCLQLETEALKATHLVTLKVGGQPHMSAPLASTIWVDTSNTDRIADGRQKWYSCLHRLFE